VTASQASMVSQPEAVTQLILSAVEETSRSRAWGYDSRATLSARLKSASEDGAQSATVRRVEGTAAAETGDGGEVIIEDAPVSTGQEAQVTQDGDYRFFAGWRSHPFFYDVGGALNDFRFTGSDYFADKDVCSIVLELPNSELGATEVGLWHRTLIPSDDVGWIQADRGART
jgi:hypothetical protein